MFADSGLVVMIRELIRFHGFGLSVIAPLNPSQSTRVGGLIRP